MTRIYAEPQPELREPTAQEAELQSIRHRLSLVAARLTSKPERVRWALGRIEDEVKRLRKLQQEG